MPANATYRTVATPRSIVETIYVLRPKFQAMKARREKKGTAQPEVPVDDE
jgi:hypothetical protein